MTPSLLSTVARCPARAGFERDPDRRNLRRHGLRAALGGIAHRALELRASGAEFEHVWAAAAAEEYRRLALEWAPAVPPAPDRWPGWALTRARIKRAWPSTAGGLRPSPPVVAMPAATDTMFCSEIPNEM